MGRRPKDDQTRPHDAPAAPGPTAYLIGRLDRVLSRHLAGAVSRFGLTVPQYTALAVLRSRGELSNARLAERSFMTPQATNEMVKIMESRQWLCRAPDPAHGRIVLIRLTPRGEKLLVQCDEAVARVEASMLNRLSAGQRTALDRALRECINNLGAPLPDH